MKSKNLVGFTKAYLLYAALLFLVSFFFVLIMASSNSPISPHFYGADSSFFSAVGGGMLRGRLPYLDYFDMKGPYLFFIQALGHLIGGTTGIFFLEVLNFFAILLIIDNCALLIWNNNPSKYFFRFLCQLPPIFFLCISFEGGNFTEEWSLLPLFICLNLFIRYISSGSSEHPVKYAFIYGICFSFLALIRVTNAAMICALVFTATVSLIYRKCFISLFKNAVAFILGAVTAALPPILIFAHWGILNEMIDCVFIFGFQYGVNGSGIYLKPLTATLLIPLLTIISFNKETDKRYIFFLVSSFLIYLYIFSMGNLYNHYFTLIMPYTVLASIWIIKSFFDPNTKRKRRIISVHIAAILILLNLFSAAQCVWNSFEFIFELDGLEEYYDASELGQIIPEGERNSVFGYVRSYKFFEINHIDNCSKYCSWQESYIKIRPEIANELEESLAANPPKWIVLSKNYLSDFAYLIQLLASDYSLVSENDSYLLYVAV